MLLRNLAEEMSPILWQRSAASHEVEQRRLHLKQSSPPQLIPSQHAATHDTLKVFDGKYVIRVASKSLVSLLRCVAENLMKEMTRAPSSVSALLPAMRSSSEVSTSGISSSEDSTSGILPTGERKGKTDIKTTASTHVSLVFIVTRSLNHIYTAVQIA